MIWFLLSLLYAYNSNQCDPTQKRPWIYHPKHERSTNWTITTSLTLWQMFIINPCLFRYLCFSVNYVKRYWIYLVGRGGNYYLQNTSFFCVSEFDCSVHFPLILLYEIPASYWVQVLSFQHKQISGWWLNNRKLDHLDQCFDYFFLKSDRDKIRLSRSRLIFISRIMGNTFSIFRCHYRFFYLYYQEAYVVSKYI